MSLEMYKINREDVNRQQEGGEEGEVTLQQPRRRAIRRTKGSLRQSKQQPLQRIGLVRRPRRCAASIQCSFLPARVPGELLGSVNV